MSDYISNPSKIEDFKHNVEFQMDNVKGWLSVNDYESALIKAKCLVDDLQAIVAFEESENIMLTETIFQNKAAVVPDISIEVLPHVDLGDRVICAHCKVNGFPAKRLTQDIYGQQVNEIPVWNLDGRIVDDWFALILEAKYKAAMDGKTIVIHPDIV